MTKRVLNVSLDAMRRVLARDVGATLPRENENSELTTKLADIESGPLALVCPRPDDLRVIDESDVVASSSAAAGDGAVPGDQGVVRCVPPCVCRACLPTFTTHARVSL